MSTSVNMYGVEPYAGTAGEEYMGEPMRQHFTKLLEAWKQELMTSPDRSADRVKADFPGPVDRATIEEELGLELRSRDRERKVIEKIDQALHKIENHAYGWCDKCGAEIGLRRLEARPTSDRCLDCR
ncbi:MULTISPECIES: RNA polymerase-binding protein DksA [Streptomyces]|uniref:RNA polymerase-binding protein DksA n=1 Tax=Streptomyces TaxID=1883 RepID=UPI001C8D16CE|nr:MULTISPECIES: RNA polymerase-binding protein DksA [Streptomyces]UBI35840.1 RNA polymerase-binding protein DksA [Streptomyces mobaraensis]UKW28434.1 RNA polymerase-binding protein DksA [Streptomyces sp. TYQ1024]